MRGDSVDKLITARLLVLQSKRLMLQSLERRLGAHPGDPAEALLERVLRMRGEAEHAHDAYRDTVLRVGAPESSDFWLVAYLRLIDKANALVRKLRRHSPDLSADEMYLAASDVEALEGLIHAWTDSMRAAMAPAV